MFRCNFDYLAMFAQFSGFKVVVLANRLVCDNDLARYAHDQLVTKLCELIELTRLALAAKKDAALNQTAACDDTAGEDLYWIDEELAFRWLSHRPHPLLDELEFDPATGEAFDARSRRWRPVSDYGPHRREATDAELCGLRRIIDQIASETGVRFCTYRIIYGWADEVANGG